MSLPDSYTQKPGALPEYFEAILNAQAPDRFSQNFLVNLGFKSTNDRLFIAILKDLGFLDTDGVPTERYFQFHDRSQWKKILADGIAEAYSDLFAINQRAHEMSTEDVANKLRTLYAGNKTDQVIGRIARTFTGLCELADFQGGADKRSNGTHGNTDATGDEGKDAPEEKKGRPEAPQRGRVALDSLQYHINIVLPETRDQGVYDAIFRSLREHLG